MTTVTPMGGIAHRTPSGFTGLTAQPAPGVTPSSVSTTLTCVAELLTVTALFEPSPVIVTVPGFPTRVTVVGAANAAVGRPNSATSASTTPPLEMRFNAEREARESFLITHPPSRALRRSIPSVADRPETKFKTRLRSLQDPLRGAAGWLTTIG